MALKHYDIVVIGSGAGGGTLVHTLAASGKSALFCRRTTKVYGAALYRLRPADFDELIHIDGVSPA